MKILVAVGAGAVKDSYFTPEVIRQLEEIGEVVYNETGRQAYTKEELIENIKDIDIIFTGWKSPRLDADVLAHANKLKIHAHTGGSVASYISQEEYEQGIIVLCGNDVFAQSVAEGCLCYTLNALRNNEESLQSMRAGEWRHENRQSKGLINKKVGIVGFGAISRYYMDLLRWFNPELYIYSSAITQEEAKQYGAKITTLEDIFSNCDVISLHSAWNSKTEGMIAEDLLKLIKPGAVFVNTARSQIVEKEGLYRQAVTGRFQLVLDVFHEEPLPSDDLFRTLPNVNLYPHMAGPTLDMREQVNYRLIESVKNILAGKPYRDDVPYEYAVRMSVH